MIPVSSIEILAAAPMMTVQDRGRRDVLKHGLSASGPMDFAAFDLAGTLLGNQAGAALEFGPGECAFRIIGQPLQAAFSGGQFRLEINGNAAGWNSVHALQPDDTISIRPGQCNFGYIRFDRELDVPLVLGSRATNLIARLGGYQGRVLRKGDRIDLLPSEFTGTSAPLAQPAVSDEPFRFTWGLHADLFPEVTRRAFISRPFNLSSRFDRMGMQLIDETKVFAGPTQLSLVSDVVVPGDIQILGDGTPIVLMRDHQPTGGYPRIGTLIPPDQDRLAQTRPGTEIVFAPVSLAHAHQIMRGQ